MTDRIRAIAACASLGALFLIAGCGGDDEKQTSTATKQTPAEATATAKPKTEQQKSAPAKTQPERTSESTPQSTVPDAGPTPGTKGAAKGVPVTPGGDNSIQTHGSEGEDAERKQATVALTTYLDARLAGQWAKACAEMSKGLKQSIQAFAGGQEGGCEAALRALTEGAPKSALRRVAQVKKVLSFRVEGEQAFLIFSAAGTVKYSPMASEDGRWKVAAIEPSEFFLGPGR